MYRPPELPEFSRRMAKAAALTGAWLEKFLSGTPLPGEIDRPEKLLAAMRHAVMAGGKRFRPFLVIESARLFGVVAEAVGRAGAAVECLHTYSLVHDDLPAMDDDDLRRGAPTVHKAFDEATAILAGDALLTLAFAILADPETDADSTVRAELVTILARGAGAGGMVGGQMLDLAAENAPADEAAIRRIQAMKTGALIAAACEMGAVLGRAGLEERRALARYGASLGLAFQIADDLLDVSSDAGSLGKAVTKDSARGKATFVSLLGEEGARALLARTVADCVTHLGDFGPEGDILRDAARFAAERRS